MPLVRVSRRSSGSAMSADSDSLFLACRQIVPAAMNSKEGRLTPGSIEFMVDWADTYLYLTVDIFIEIEAFHYDDRENLDERAESIRAALSDLFPGVTFGVWPKLVKAGYAADSKDPEFDGDLGMPAALERAKRAIVELGEGADLEDLIAVGA
jgi:hypothetical protein